ncbi:MAG TPA: hypothetical protein PKM57_01235 [Kiritimatiellia bacterium]|nr:hypothetical protein [Kiritimatiellia bacterium]HPS08824.1 hypothetical protein [Kiritimatiellia bacterium]
MKSLADGVFIVLFAVLNASAVSQPDAISNLVFWVKADAGVTTNESGHVTEWADQSAQGNLATNIAASGPLYVASEPGLNNRPTLRFNGSSQRMTVVNRMLTNGIEGCTIIAMAKAGRNDDVSIIGIRTGSGNPLVQLDQDSSGKLRFIVRNALNVTANALSVQVHTGTFGMYAGRLFKGTDTVWTNRVYFSNARTAEATASANFGTSTDLTSGTQYIGGLGIPAYWQGDIAEIMIYERALSEAEMVGIEGYLASRYKVGRDAQTADLPEDNPGLKLWLRADVCTYEDLFANDDVEPLDAIRLWSDATTNSHDAVAVETPTLVTNMVNGLPAVGFSYGAADRYYLDAPITTDPRQLVVFAVFRQWPGDMEQNMVFTHRKTDTQLIQSSFQHATNAVLQIRGSGNVIRTITVPGLLTNGAFNVVMYQFDAVNDRHAVAVNGGTEAVDTYDFGNQTFIADTQRIGCYHLNGSEGLFLRGHLAELLVYEGVTLTRKQKNRVGFYLETKYGLDTGYAPSGTLIQIY